MISIIIPCYNQAQFLPEALESVLSQTYQRWECIIVNDGSTDNTDEVAKEWLKRDERFIYIKKVNGGLSSARNEGLKAATGQYIVFLDSDDWLDADFLEKLLRVSMMNGADVTMSNMKWALSPSGETGQLSWMNRIFNALKSDIITEVSDRKKVMDSYSVCNKLFLKDFLDKYKFFFYEGLFWEDNPYTIMTTIRANKICLVRDSFYYYRKHEKSISSTALSDRKPFHIFEILSRLRVFFEAEGINKNAGYHYFYEDLLFKYFYVHLVDRVNQSYRKEFYYRVQYEFRKLNKDCRKHLKRKYRSFTLILNVSYSCFFVIYRTRLTINRLFHKYIPVIHV